MTSRDPLSRARRAGPHSPGARFACAGLLVALLAAPACSRPSGAGRATERALQQGERQLPTGARIAPIGATSTLGSMPLAMLVAPDGQHAVVSLGGWREQGVQIVETATGRVTQTLLQPAAFVGMAFSPDGRTLYASGGDADRVYVYEWASGSARLRDSILLGPAHRAGQGTRYPAGIALAPDGQTLYVAENLGDSLAVVDVAARRVVQRLATGRYPYGVIVAPDGTVYVSTWGSETVSSFAPRGGRLGSAGRWEIARHPSAMLLNADGSRLFVASATTDRVVVFDTRRHAVVATLGDAAPNGPGEGSTPNALALSRDGRTLYVAEADNNAVALFSLSDATAGVTGHAGTADRLEGRVPTPWYPTGVAPLGDQLLVVTGKGLGTGPNPDGPGPTHPRTPGMRSYTLGQTTGSFTRLPLAEVAAGALAENSARVAALNGWTTPRTQPRYPPFTHVIYVIKENRTYDQVFGDMPEGDGDTALVFFPRRISPNHHALAERFGLFDRFFTNAEVSPDGHNWSTAAYVSDYGEKTIPSQYSDRRRPYDYEGTNRAYGVEGIIDDDVNAPANGYLWDAAQRAGISFRDYGEFVVPEVHRAAGTADTEYVGDKPFLRTHTNPRFAGFNLDIRDQRRIDVWLDDFNEQVRTNTLPALEIMRLPNDHTSGLAAGKPTPFAAVADNDLALGRMVQALSASPYWANTVMFVLEDDAQNGPDHVDSHRAPAFVISAYNRPGVQHRWTNTTDVVASIIEILHLQHLSQFDADARPLADVFAATPDRAPYVALPETVPLDAVNPRGTRGATDSRRLDLSAEDRADEDLFNRILWRGIKGDAVPYPGAHRVSPLELRWGQ